MSAPGILRQRCATSRHQALAVHSRHLCAHCLAQTCPALARSCRELIVPRRSFAVFCLQLDAEKTGCTAGMTAESVVDCESQVLRNVTSGSNTSRRVEASCCVKHACIPNMSSITLREYVHSFLVIHHISLCLSIHKWRRSSHSVAGWLAAAHPEAAYWCSRQCAWSARTGSCPLAP
jgi:hypothetical protein